MKAGTDYAECSEARLRKAKNIWTRNRKRRSRGLRRSDDDVWW